MYVVEIFYDIFLLFITASSIRFSLLLILKYKINNNLVNQSQPYNLKIDDNFDYPLNHTLKLFQVLYNLHSSLMSENKYYFW